MNTAQQTEQDTPSLLSRAVQHLNAGDSRTAEQLLAEVLRRRPGLPQAMMLMGVVRLEQNRPDEAESILTQVLKDNPGQPMALFYLGNALRAKGESAAAVSAYRNALQARAGFADAELALAGTLRTIGQLRDAEKLYRAILARNGSFVPALAGLGAALNELEAYPQAEAILSAGLRLPAENDVAADLENSLGFAKMLQRRFAEALPHFDRAVALTPALLAAERNRATVLELLHHPERAAAAYRRVLAQDPMDLKTHLLLNELLHRADRDSEMLRSYDQAIVARPASPVPPTAKGDQLQLLERACDAVGYYQRALKLAPGHAAAHIGLARAMSALGDHGGAIAAFETGRRSCPDDADLQTAFAYYLLGQADSPKAQTLVEGAIARSPHNQAALAVLGLCYRANNDSREDLLNDYDRFVQIFDLDPPKGYSDIAAFHADLRTHLETLHSSARQFFSQTLRGGTRVPEDIFQYRHALRDKLKWRITDALGRYIEGMKDDPSHPFLGRRTDQFRFSGSWSSRMQDGGFHTNHIHTGWISSCYYVDVPDVAGDATTKQGWLKFGEPSADLGFADTIRRIVQPKPGRLVLFPSFLWHGTVPFHSDQARMTIAFDAIPLPKNQQAGA